MNSLFIFFLTSGLLICGNEFTSTNLPKIAFDAIKFNSIDGMLINQIEPKLVFDYYSNDELAKFVLTKHQTYPNLTKLYTIGNSVRENKLYVLALSQNINQKRALGKPMIKFIANQYGDQVIGRQLLIYLIEYLLLNYNQTKYVTQILNSIELHFLITMNPDGFNLAKEGECDFSDAHFNANCVDLNSKFPNHLDLNGLIFTELTKSDTKINLLLRNGLNSLYINRKTKFFYHEPEIESIIKWIHSESFILSLSFYAGQMGVIYPYFNSRFKITSNQTNPTPDNDLFQFLSYAYASGHKLMNNSTCKFHESDLYSVFNGAFVLNKSGTMQDYNYFFSSCFEIAVYLTCCNYPSKQQLQSEWFINKIPMLNFMKFAHLGIKGVIYDKKTNMHLDDVFICVEGNEHITLSNLRGEYWRLLLDGDYNITFEHTKYFNKTFQVKILNNYENALRLDVYLEPKPSFNIIKNFSISETELNEIDGQSQPFESEYKILEQDFKTMITFKYHTYNEMVNFLIHYHIKYSNITRLYSIGQSFEERDLLVLEITENPGKHELLKPEFKYAANFHGIEVVSKEILLLFIKKLLDNYGRDEKITQLIRTTRIHIMPCFNPDSNELAKTNSQCQNISDLNNFNNKDLNIDPFSKKDLDLIEQETLMFMSWLDEYQFILSGNLFVGELVVVYPFNPYVYGNKNRSSLTQDSLLFQKLAKTYSQNHPKMKLGQSCKSKCDVDQKRLEKFDSGIVSDAEWKHKTSFSQNYNYLLAYFFDLSIYLSCDKYPPKTELMNLWLENRLSLLRFVEQIHSGVKGILRRSTDNKILRDIDILIQVEGSKKDIGSTSMGDYFRLLNPGKYNITISSEGYIKQTKFVEVFPNEVSILNFTLAPQKAHNHSMNLSDHVISCLRAHENIFSLCKEKNCQASSQGSSEYHKIFSLIILFSLIFCLIVLFYAYNSLNQKLNLGRSFNTFMYSASDEEEPMMNDENEGQAIEMKITTNPINDSVENIIEISE